MFNVTQIITTGGLALIGLIVFAEVGLFLGFILPGDTLLLTAGIFAHEGKLPLTAVIIVIAITAVLGDLTAFTVGRLAGNKYFQKERRGAFVNTKNLEKSKRFYDKYGGKTVLIAHFVPIIRTFTPPIAGASGMPPHRYLIYDIIGDCAWSASVTLMGYFVGSRIPGAQHYIFDALMVLMALTIGSGLYQIYRYKRAHKKKVGTELAAEETITSE